MTWIKICGLTTVADARRAVGAGADALGFVFTASKRRIEPPEARRIADDVRGVGADSPPGRRPVDLVGVFTDEPAERILWIGETVGLDVIQLHTPRAEDEAARLRAAGYRVLQAVRVRDAESLRPWTRRRLTVDALLLDAWSNFAVGGTGERFDWSLLEGDGRGALDRLRPVVLAGGLKPTNVREALSRFKPDGVDVSSGVEDEPGRKNEALMRQFVTEVRAHDGNTGTVSARRLA